MSHEWRNHPKLREKLHPEHPDDVQVIAHDGGPRTTKHKPELVWVTVTGMEGDVFLGNILNKPDQLSSVSQNSQIRFLVPTSGEYPILITSKYLRERPDWIVQPCNQCGLSELFDPPSDLMRIVFPDLPSGSIMEAFTAFCGACGGVQVVQYKGADLMDQPHPSPKKWWEFWK